MILGKEVNQKNRLSILAKTGSLIESPAYYGHLSGKENLRIICTLKDVPFQEADRVLKIVRMTEQHNKKVGQYSLGMKQRLGLAAALLGSPDLLLLDEPTNGLDPAGMRQIRSLLKTLSSEYGTTIMISSHILSEIETIADMVGVIHQGRMAKEISMEDIQEMSLAYIELTVLQTKPAAFVLSEKLGLENFKIIEEGKIRIYDDRVSTQELAKVLTQNQVDVTELGKKAETLEDYFLKMTGPEVGP